MVKSWPPFGKIKKWVLFKRINLFWWENNKIVLNHIKVLPTEFQMGLYFQQIDSTQLWKPESPLLNQLDHQCINEGLFSLWTKCFREGGNSHRILDTFPVHTKNLVTLGFSLWKVFWKIDKICTKNLQHFLFLAKLVYTTSWP